MLLIKLFCFISIFSFHSSVAFVFIHHLMTFWWHSFPKDLFIVSLLVLFQFLISFYTLYCFMSGLVRALSFIVFVKHFELHVYICDCSLNKVPTISGIPLLCVLNSSSRTAQSHLRPRFTAHKSLHYLTVTQQNLFSTTIPKHSFSKHSWPINHQERSFAFHGLLNMTQLYDAGYTPYLFLL